MLFFNHPTVFYYLYNICVYIYYLDIYIILLYLTNYYDIRYLIPNNIFYDAEDGDVKHLKLTMLNTDPALLSWVEFDVEKQILLALYDLHINILNKCLKLLCVFIKNNLLYRPLEDHVSKWEIVIEASDSGKLTVNNTLELVVQQLPHLRAINHQFILQMRLKPDSLEWTQPVSWSLDFLDKISNIYSTDVKNITVLQWPTSYILAATNKDRPSVEFIWTNDTLPRDICPSEKIIQLLGVCIYFTYFSCMFLL